MSAANFMYSISGSLGKVHIGCTGKVSNELLSLQEDKKKKLDVTMRYSVCGKSQPQRTLNDCFALNPPAATSF